jgi:hypothetical protein
MSVLIIFFIISAPYSLFFFSSTRADLSMKQIQQVDRTNMHLLKYIGMNARAASPSKKMAKENLQGFWSKFRFVSELSWE